MKLQQFVEILGLKEITEMSIVRVTLKLKGTLRVTKELEPDV